MLRQILDTFGSSPEPMNLDALSRRLGIERIQLEAMLDELVRMGRLVRSEDRAAVACPACGFKNGCPYVMSNAGACYTLPPSQVDSLSASR